MKIHHLGIAVKDVESSSEAYQKSLGWKKETAVIEDPVQKVKVLFMVDENGNRFELLEPVGSDSPIKKLIQNRVSLYHFCYEVTDIQLKIKELISKGFFLISGPVVAVALNNHLIAFLINGDNLIIELVELQSAVK